MGYSSEACNIRRQGYATGPVALSELPVPDPRLWPPEIRQWFHRASRDDGTFGVLIFDCGTTGAMILRDAITALGILEIEEGEWHVEDGYPAFEFAAEKIAYFARRLTLAGYNVRVVQAPIPRTGRSIGMRARGRVVSIGAARPQVGPEGARWE